MPADALALVLDQLNRFILRDDGGGSSDTRPAIWGNVAQLDHPETALALENQLLLSLVNVQEEGALRNTPGAAVGPQGVTYRHPPLHLNLFLLFSANYRNYETALKRLAQVLRFFQGRRVFTLASAPGALPDPPPFEDLSLTVDLLSLSFEEINHLWGSLGGRQMPFALYRGRMVVLETPAARAEGGLVREVDVVGRGT